MKARSYSRTYGMETDELESEGGLIFVKACRAFDGSRGAFTTFLWRCLDNGLLSFCLKQRRQAFWELTEDGILPDVRHDEHVLTKRSIHLRQSLAILPTPARSAMRLLMERPTALGLDGGEPPRAVRTAIRRHIRDSGESWGVTWQTMKEIKNIFQEEV